MVLTLADPLAALVARVKLATDVTAWTADRVGVQVQPGWQSQYAVSLTPAGGTIDDEPPLAVARVNVRCFGPRYQHDAMALRNRVLAFLMPQTPGTASGFRLAGCVVQSVQHEGGPLVFADFEGKPWPVVIDFLLVRHSLVPS